jgi:hypothetical protein
MTADEFRELALSLSGVTEGSHMQHPDFRAHGRIFATLGYPDAGWGMVKLPLDEQKRCLELHPQVFVPAKGAWGLQGSTMVRLEAAQRDVLAPALDLAWQNSASPVAKKKPVAKKAPKKSKSLAARARS